VADFFLRPPAVAELKQAYKWYQGERLGLGEEFLQAVRASADRAVAGPAAYAIVHRDTRRVLVHRFRYGMFFRVVYGTVVFVACFHLHRKPASWKRRR
jgi:plasmid stabilization system protein ParE